MKADIGERIVLSPDSMLNRGWSETCPKGVSVVSSSDERLLDRDFDYLLFNQPIEFGLGFDREFAVFMRDWWISGVGFRAPNDRSVSLGTARNWFGVERREGLEFSLPKERGYAVYGCGEGGKNALQRLGSDLGVVCFVESQPSDRANFEGLPVVSPREMSGVGVDFCLVASMHILPIARTLRESEWPLNETFFLNPLLTKDVRKGSVTL